ncbi:MAG: hypothetical protein QOK51_01910 [Nitrososphaeraceae archaeon]|nr:hypothetical protein [Nitrososphaeraceae archaeon]MDW0188951.1 hypothetical protein [Nitrososphaeraceae archaeon]MDW0211531.1 hypothetical protein [Nitrososphaeraceae archaeon]MDW0219720.1 hypothetical protein [Nitrososphaeraceae archaeon]MDW0228582.1 hypothetical protein [Nitrososphaeraceae archaeon]
MNTKNILMFVALSLGILTALTGTGISQVAPAFADKDECEDNDDKNCNKKEIEQTNDCGITVDNSNNNQGLSENNGGLSTSCSNFAANPDDVEDQSQVGQGQSLEPHDQVFGPTT